MQWNSPSAARSLCRYDFLVFAYQSVVISKLFFPPSDSTSHLLSVYGIFAAGFITRPLGALVFGWIGDRYSRKTALLASIYLMSIPTTLMGCLPTYSQVGIIAPWLLVLTRIAQGFAVGGEFTATMVFLVEHAPKGQEGLMGSWAFFSVMIGVLTGSSISMAFNYALTDSQLYSWGWRVPFLISVLGAAVGVYMRRHVHEPPAEAKQNLLVHTEQMNNISTSQPNCLLDDVLATQCLLGGADAAEDIPGGDPGSRQDIELELGCLSRGADQVNLESSMMRITSTSTGSSESRYGCSLHSHDAKAATAESLQLPSSMPCGGLISTVMKAMSTPVGRAVQGSVTVFIIDSLTAVGFYLVVIYMPTYFQVYVGLSRQAAMSVHSFNMVLYMLLVPAGGMLADRLGFLPLLVIPSLFMTLLGWPLWMLLSRRDSIVSAFEGQALLCVLLALFSGALPGTFVSLFDPKYRCLGLSVGHNMSMALLGGTAPLIATALITTTGSNTSPGVMLAAAGALTLFGSAGMSRWLFRLA
ncbi:hypothetical protein CEUSTIGMA_g10431.t1 [Chlamydomonas eustigma]|uniref:Major facilitator superfamily (MFS) profile domain-containing protein n=1 Tax=Chlamydomonas eustigma TaxID=1157962 RepID=A0A250XIU8_9CHLO|nr:hypothetical protein CEUSTIGMA_g10431.t1 [Chlamydomonas eustigma]|eukprot:GAX83004.1 hypothetical protein CEUSTIGMA_g10431.t1 [Chlamydomonas eustigma]